MPHHSTGTSSRTNNKKRSSNNNNNNNNNKSSSKSNVSSPSTAGNTSSDRTTNGTSKPQCFSSRKVQPESIKGSDDAGNFISSHAKLMELQTEQKEHWYSVNRTWWDEGYGGKTDDEAMIGDEGGGLDGDEGLAFLDRLLLYIDANHQATTTTTTGRRCPRVHAIDAGAGVGRVTKLVLLKRFDHVRLVEANPGWSKRSRVYLGRKRADRCQFTCANLQDLGPNDFELWGLGASSGGGGSGSGSGRSREKSGGGGGSTGGGVDLIWLQWTLQYLTDADAIHTLQTLAAGLVADTGYLVLKENRPFGTARADRFQLETPSQSGRYDITRPDAHHRLLFEHAGLQVAMSEQGEETNTYALRCAGV